MACSPASCCRPTVVVSGKEYTDARCIRFLFGTNVPPQIAPIVSYHVRMAWGWDVVFCVVAALRRRLVVILELRLSSRLVAAR